MRSHDLVCLKMFEDDGCSYGEIAKKLDLSYDQVKHALKRARIAKGYDMSNEDKSLNLEESLLKCLKKGVTKENLCEMFELSENKLDKILDDFSDSGICIDVFDDILKLGKESIPDNFIHNHASWRGDIVKFGMVSDTHLCSRYCEIESLHNFYKILEKEEIDTVYHAGDILDGEGLYQGHSYELSVIGSDAQIDHTLENYPKVEGITTRFVTGNHDLSYYKKQGRDVGRALAAERDDLDYLGQWGAYVTFGDGKKEVSQDGIKDAPSMYLLHPDSGPSYAISYKPQKLATSFPEDVKPDIMGIGHYHQAEYLYYSEIHIVQCCSFQAMTPYIRRKGIHPIIGGWIITVGLDDNKIQSFKSELVTF